VRKPQNIIERAVILSTGPTLQVALADLQSEASPAPNRAPTCRHACQPAGT
jgi:hypothetical protein